MISENSEQLSS